MTASGEPSLQSCAAQAQSRAQLIRAHIERHIGRIEQVFAGPAAGAVRIDLHHVAPVESRPYHTLITGGMSSLPMHVPGGTEAPARIELMMTLPERWRLDTDDGESRWPVRLLQELGNLPHERQSWLGWGHIVPNGEPPRPFARNTSLCGVIIAPSLLVPVAFYELDAGSERIAFYGAIALYAEELQLRQRAGMEALLERLVQKDINDVVEPRRRNVAKKRFGLF